MCIADRWREQKSIRAIAGELNRSLSTISREIRRNGSPDARPNHPSQYRPFTAHRRAQARLPRSKPRKVDRCPELRDFIQAWLDEKWSPEQVAHILPRDFPDRPEMQVRHETIYRALYVQAQDRPDTRGLAAPADGPKHAQAAPPTEREDSSVHSPDGPDQPAARRSHRPQRPGALGRGPDRRHEERLSDRHSRRTQHPLHAAGTPPGRVCSRVLSESAPQCRQRPLSPPRVLARSLHGVTAVVDGNASGRVRRRVTGPCRRCGSARGQQDRRAGC